MNKWYKSIIALFVIFVMYVGLHIYHPNPENTTKNWAEYKEMFYDDNNKMYFLNYDSYFYVNQANKLYDGRSSWNDIDFDFQTAFLYLDRLIFGNYTLSYYLSFFIGFGVLFLLYCCCYMLTHDETASFVATYLFAINDFFFANTVFNYVDNTVLNLLFFMLFFCVIISNVEYWKKCLLVFIIYVLLLFNWNGAFLFIFILVLSLFFYYYYTKINIRDNKKEIIVCICAVAFFGILFYFLGYFDVIQRYLGFGNSSISELQHTTLNLFYLALFFFPLMFIFDNFFKENIDYKNMFLMSFLFVLIFVGLWYLRLFIYCLPFIFITVALFFAKIEKWYYPVLLYAILMFIFYSFVPFSTYDGGIYGVPFVDDSLVKTGEWIKENIANDTIIITAWDYGMFYETFAERNAKYKASPVGIDLFNSWLYGIDNKGQTLVNIKQLCGSSLNCVILVDEHWSYNGFRNTIKGNRAAYPADDTIYYKLINRQNISNMTLLYEQYGGRLGYYYVYGVK